MAEIDLLKKSVTAGDYSDTPRGGVINFMIPWYPGASATGLPPEPPQWWSRARDYTLRSTVLYEDMWKAAIGIAITKVASTSWEVDSEVPLRARRGQNILNDSGWFKLLAMGLRDYLTTDNGQFIEIVRATKSPVSMAIGLAHLDSLRCTRTGDPEIPLIYTDRKGREHEIRYENVIMLSDMPDPGDTWFGVGTCAASGAFRSIYKLSVIERYVSEKVSGRRPLAIHFVSAVGQRQLDGIVQSAEEHAARQGLLSYMGAIVVPLLDASVPPQVSTVPLAELPDRFNRKEEYDIALYSYSANIGLDIQDLQPLTGQPLGTGAQSQILDEKAKGKGLVYWKKEFPSELNLKVFDDMTTFAFIEKDYRDQERQAAISKMRADTSGVRIDKGITTPSQEVQILVDLDELPNEFLSEDVTGETLSDTEKPDKEEAGEGEMVEEPQTREPAAEEQPATTKGGEGSGFFGHAGRPGEVGGSSSEGGKDVPDYFYSKDARTLPPEIDNRLDGGPGKSIQYHGSPQKGITEFGTNEVYLQDNPEEAKGYSAGRHMMQNKKGGEILQVRRKPGKTLNLDPELLRRMEEGDDPDDVINEYINPAKERGFRYIYFEHPTFSGEGSQKVIISLFPKDDLKIVGRVRNKEQNICDKKALVISYKGDGLGIGYSCTECHKTFKDIEDWESHTKAKDDDLDKLYLQELNEAVKLYQDAGGEMPETPGMKETMAEIVGKACKTGKKKIRKVKRVASQTS